MLSLYIAREKNLGIIPQLILLSPLLFKRDEELGLKNLKKGILWGAPFLILSIPYLANARCYGFVLNQLGVAFAEELFFRGFLMERFNNLTVSLLFALSHFVYWSNLNALLTFFPSLLFGWLYQRSGSLIAPVLAHFSLNLFYFYLLDMFPEIRELLLRSFF
ncbi:MAG: CPBP family intramembrane metalloprotease [Aquificae bacterium]|nr:CPBP family intramembrane metalloprotease [Aquificota bacterium]